MTHQTIVVLDFGSQFTQLIARRLRELSVYSEILPFDTPLAEIRAREARSGIVLSGGPQSVSEAGAPRCEPGVFDAGVPVLGICYGMQLMTDALGGEVAPAPHREFGLATITIEPGAPLLRVGSGRSCASGRATATSSRPRPPGFTVTATSANAPVAAMADEDRAALRAAVPSGGRAHRSRHSRSCATSRSTSAAAPATGRWRRSCRRRSSAIRAQVGDGRVVCGLSGGVDSTVAALLIHQAIGDRLTCIFVDNGVMRQDEAAQIRRRFERLQLPLVFADASALFLDRLAGVTDPEQKRKIIGAAFIDVFEAEAKKLGSLRLPRAGHAVSGRHRERVGRSGRRT